LQSWINGDRAFIKTEATANEQSLIH